jgi:hypothetical protein
LQIQPCHAEPSCRLKERDAFIGERQATFIQRNLFSWLNGLPIQMRNDHPIRFLELIIRKEKDQRYSLP